MSVNIPITITLDFKIFAAIKNRSADPKGAVGTKKQGMDSAEKAIIAAIDAMPFNIKPESPFTVNVSFPSEDQSAYDQGFLERGGRGITMTGGSTITNCEPDIFRRRDRRDRFDQALRPPRPLAPNSCKISVTKNTTVTELVDKIYAPDPKLPPFKQKLMVGDGPRKSCIWDGKVDLGLTSKGSRTMREIGIKKGSKIEAEVSGRGD